jgi:predicted dehydrogenase
MQTINTALLSFGMSGKVFHAPLLQAHKGFVLAEAWERNKKCIQQIYPATQSYPSLEQIVNDETIDLVVVNTPIYTHYDYATKALLANKHVIVEKAFTTTVQEAEALKKLAQQQNKMLSVFQNRRWDSDFKTVKKIIQSKILGNINEVEIHFDRFRLELSPKLHKEKPNAGAGILKDLGAHIIDQSLYLFGMPQQVFADIRTSRPHSEVDDEVEIILYFPTFRVRLKMSYMVKQPLPSYIVHGTKGSFIKSRADVQETQLQSQLSLLSKRYGIEPVKERGILVTDEKGKTKKKKIETQCGNYLQYYDGIYAAITKNKPAPVTADEGICTMKIIEAAIKSNHEKRVVEME